MCNDILMTSDTKVPHQPDTIQQHQPSSFNQFKLLTLLAAVILITIVAGTGGYLLGMRNNQYAQIALPTLGKPSPPPTPIVYIPPLPSSEVPINSGPQPTPLQSAQDLPLIAATVIDWVSKNNPSPGNPQISFLENDGMYAQGLIGDLTQAGGEGWFAAKINGKWTVMYVGQSRPKCSDIAQYHLPKDWLPCD